MNSTVDRCRKRRLLVTRGVSLFDGPAIILCIVPAAHPGGTAAHHCRTSVPLSADQLIIIRRHCFVLLPQTRTRMYARMYSKHY